MHRSGTEQAGPVAAATTYDEPAVITSILAAVNTGLFVYMVACGADVFAADVFMLVAWGANYGPQTTNGQWWRLITSIFIHASFVHLALNMWFLWHVGQLVERLMGRWHFLLLYLISGILGTLASLCWNPQVVTAGASGAVFGTVGALMACLCILRSSLKPRSIAKLRNNALLFVAINVALGFLIDGIDLAAHLGGLLAGFVFTIHLGISRRTVARPEHRLKLGLVLFSAAGVIIGMASVIPSGGRCVLTDMEHFVEVEQRCLGNYNAAAQQFGSGEISRFTLADLVDSQILPSWRTAGDSLRKLDAAQLSRMRIAEGLPDYIRTRAESWELLVRGLRQYDESKIARHREKWAEADRLVRRWNDPGQVWYLTPAATN